jgi:uncharacterized phage protein gp47/JayE
VAVEFFTTDPQVISDRVSAAIDAMVDDQGALLFPDHRRPGTPGYNIKSLVVQEVLLWHREANAAQSTQSPRTASGVYLREWANFFQKPAAGVRYAKGEVVIEAQTTGEHLARIFGTRRIAEGTILSSGAQRFKLLQDVEIPDGERRVRGLVQSETPGPGVRLAAGAALTVEHAQLRNLLRATAASDVAGGSFEETDEELRYRLVRALIDPTTFEGYRTTLLAHPDVSDAQLTTAAYGPGTLEAFVIPALSLPTRTLRDELEAIWQGAGSVYVTFPDYEGLQIQIRVAGTPGASADTKAIASYVNNLALGQTLILNAIEALVQTAGATDAQVIALRRGSVDLDGDLVDPQAVRQVTNLSPRSPRSKWFTRPEWITICQA